jgi:hypothetical protein
MLPETKLNALGVGVVALTLRHELGHCNGWISHDGGRTMFADTVEMPKLPASIHELPAYPPFVCVTPDWKPQSCKDRAAQ